MDITKYTFHLKGLDLQKIQSMYIMSKLNVVCPKT